MNKTIERIRKFREDRDWSQFHTPENLAKAINIEAGELLEHFLLDNNFNKEEVCEELADVMVYCLHMADLIGVDIEDIINKKMDKNEKNIQQKKLKEIVRNILNYSIEKYIESGASALAFNYGDLVKIKELNAKNQNVGIACRIKFIII